jgi:hypothetical protein
LLLYSSHLALGVSNWPVIYFINYTHHHRAINKFFWRRCRGTKKKKKKKLTHQLGASKTPSSFSGAVAGEEEDFCEGSFSHAHPLLFFKFFFTLFLLVSYYQRPKKIRILDSCFYLSAFRFTKMATPKNTKLCDFTSTNNSDFICTPIAPLLLLQIFMRLILLY